MNENRVEVTLGFYCIGGEDGVFRYVAKEKYEGKSINELAYNTYKSTRCAYAFYKLSKNQAVQDNTKDLCGIIKSEPIADLSLAK